MNKRICINCKHARKAGNTDKVACGFLSFWKHGLKYPAPNVTEVRCPHCNEVIGGSNNFEEYFNRMTFLHEDKVYEGWAYLGSKPNGEKSGMMSNFCIIVDKDNCCENYAESEE